MEAPMTRGLKWTTALVTVALIAVALVLWLRSTSAPPVPPAPEAQVAAPAASVPATAAASGIEHRLDTPAAPLAAGDIKKALGELFGAKAVVRFFQIDEFPRRFVATVDNLGRPHAPPALWPVHPTEGRFTVEKQPDGPVIAADNAGRYTPLVLLAESVDASRAVDVYVRMYPLLQSAYEELGYPRSYFNNRLIAVLDLLLATPEAEYPVKLQLTEVKGPIPSERPWVRYEYADPSLEALTSGRKILLRSGAVNERRLKARLAAFREELVKRSVKR
jgi:hypothetical protein